MELESEVINAYLAVKVNDFNKENPRGQRATFIDTFEMSRIWNNGTSRLKIDPLDYAVILGIVNDHHHWTLTVMYPAQKRCQFLDPLGESTVKVKRCTEITRRFLKSKGCNISKLKCNSPPHPQQPDGTSCGVFALKFAESILSSEDAISFATTKQAIAEHRWNIATTLIQQTDYLSAICCYCAGQRDEYTYWIACDVCNRWFHHECVGRPPTHRTYICGGCI
ncbi:hypothetical protein OYC64_010098 [Pagothenia borchgrevinki]|uniref:Ubiquitin-like protease family profile domain-containing protein n=1 Tax=Pagothenia borchgrevinki TaxID=8213 RepID=A0ABD2H9T7_PAGBO